MYKGKLPRGADWQSAPTPAQAGADWASEEWGILQDGCRLRSSLVWCCNPPASRFVQVAIIEVLSAAVQDNSLLQMPPWCNPWLLVAMALSFALHFLILYVPVLAGIFSIVPLSLNEWLLVIIFAFPVVLIDEALKFVGRNFVHPPTQPASLEAKKRQ